ncbi:MAG: HigA family addiction module antitoxin [Candidatus Hodarchaeales archaeon]
MKKKLSPITPGDILLEEFLKPMEITQSQLAKDINVPANRVRVSQLIHCKREITADTALRLGRYFGIEPEFWLNLQSRYNMKIAQIKIGRKIVQEVKVRIPQKDSYNHAAI